MDLWVVEKSQGSGLKLIGATPPDMGMSEESPLSPPPYGLCCPMTAISYVTADRQI